ncbi:protein phosphatase 1E-like [Mizuhopecten yessoensis]|uniref:Protein phosphatase 1E n=1 Tax=Mizuhopecten yessoensis TaxID=6573 RepID=A0A210Q0G7_MIZYE|nr:protein phosphatase 1E-like [Mizuhopecten yessoensis]OWF42240.1 Protein phosphatase 1E [Mizuhopecten yessoensis]
MERGNDLASFQRFLDKFCQTIADEGESEDLPIRLSNHRLLTDEIEGECLEWSVRYLEPRKCPPTLAAALGRAVVEEILKSDLTDYEEDVPSSGQGEENNGQTTEIIKKDPPTVLEAQILCTHTIEVLHDICKKWRENLPHLSPPPKVSKSYLHEIKNTRRKMEDRHVILPDLNSLFNLKDQPPQSYYAVFDGHAGVEAATYAATHLHCHLVRCEEFQKNPAGALKCAYKGTDEKYLLKAEREKLKSGSTGVSILIRENKLHLAWLGDSQAMLVKNGEAVVLMDPHKPEREDERRRIEAAGGCVLFMGTWRVNGNLAVSRAIGDAAHKKFIISDADTTSVSLDGTEDYIVLACDGLWDVLTPNGVPKLVYDFLQDSKGDKSCVAQKLVNWAKENGSTDNITVIVVFLRDDIAEPHVTQMFKFGQSESQGNDDFVQEDSTKGGNSQDQNKNNTNHNDMSGGTSNGNTDGIDSSQHGNDHSTDPLDHDEFSIQKVLNETTDSINNHFPLPKDHILRKDPVFIVDHPKTVATPKPNDIRSASMPERTLDKNSSYFQHIPKVDHAAVQLQHLPHWEVREPLSHREPLSKEGVEHRQYRHLPVSHREPLTHHQDLEPLRDLRLKVKKKAKKPKKEHSNRDSTLNALKKVSKRHNHSDPVIWAFTGKSRAPLPNYKLNLTKSTQFSSPKRVALATVYPNSLSQDSPLLPPDHPANSVSDFLVDKMLRSKPHTLDTIRNRENIPNPVFDLPLSTFTNSASQTSTTSMAQHPMSMLVGKTNNVTGEDAIKARNFHTSWRPRKTSKLHSSVSWEVPPTPLSNVKILPSLDD